MTQSFIGICELCLSSTICQLCQRFKITERKNKDANRSKTVARQPRSNRRRRVVSSRIGKP